MKKNNTNLADDEIDLGNIIKSLWREKILILSISIVCGLVGYFYGLSKPQELRTEILLKNPPTGIFEPYNLFNNNNQVGQFMSDFKLNFFSLDNLESFIHESREFDNFKTYLKLKNISAKEYFKNKIGEAKEKNLIIPNKYFLFFTKELDGDIFLNNYAKFIMKKTVFIMKKNLELSIGNRITIFENSLEKAKLINMENPILKSMNNTSQVVYEPENLFYKGSKILSHDIIYLKKLLIKLENDQFNFDFILDKPLNFPVKKMSYLAFFGIGLTLGIFLSLVIIFFKSILKNN